MISQVAREALVAEHFLLRHLEPGQLSRLAAAAAITRHPAHATIFEKGDPGDSMMAVVRGRVKICTYSAEGRELVLNIVSPGEMFGEIALLDGEPRTANAVALEPTDLMGLTRARFLPLLAENPEMATRLIAVLCKRLRQTSEHLEDTLFLEAPSRLARTVMRLCAAFGIEAARVAGKPVTRIDIKLNQQQLGNLVGLSRESVNKILGEWTKAGLVKFESSVISVLDREAIAEIAEAL